MKKYNVIGLMSGTSMDGLDLAYVQFAEDNGWSFDLLEHKSLDYDDTLRSALKDSIMLDGLHLKLLDIDYGRFLGNAVSDFIRENQLNPDLIVSHGHTVFHRPDKSMTMQIGDGYQIYKATNIDTICDLRSADVALGGQGAPLVPFGDKELFGNYDYCLNLGGFANVSFDDTGSRQAYDICAVNTVLNHLAGRLGKSFDKDGALARKGHLLPSLMQKLEALDYYSKPFPKSLGIEWVNSDVLPLLHGDNIVDLLHTYTRHSSMQIWNAIKKLTLHQGISPASWSPEVEPGIVILCNA